MDRELPRPSQHPLGGAGRRGRELRLHGNLRRALALGFRRTQRGTPRRVLLYETVDCGLCAEVFRALARLALEIPLEIVRIDIEADPALRGRYALRVPVVAAGGREIDAAGVGEDALRRFVAGH